MDEEGDHMAIGNGDGVFPAASGAKTEGGAVKVGEGFGEGCERRGDGCGRDTVVCVYCSYTEYKGISKCQLG